MKKPMDTIISERARLRERVVTLREDLAAARADAAGWEAKYREEVRRSSNYFQMFGRAQEEEHRLRRVVIGLGGKP